ncbi:11308_t:CDS:2 [Funneliformis geosporum]|uniref:15421_t:CDS:1 n=1 Tax=Funneliformis geosporum TaxID=1117311 RepID=A0A9W4SQ55_9GLOM|nr:11308_t:CDS:2 [Funneliformis geosporum]CAI2175138.1 15421_t:CDS:2 [Funneliformis geosporum]
MNPVPITECTYESTFWPQISDFVRHALRADLQAERPLHTYSHEELYRSIYWMCWQGLHKRLFSDLTSSIEETLHLLSSQLDNIQQLDIWFHSFAKISINHAKATEILGSVFAYLDKTYIQCTLRQNLRDLLIFYFQKIITEKSEMRIIYVFSMILENPIMFDLNLVVDVVKALYKIKPDYIYLNPILFQNSIEDIKLPSNLQDLQVRYTTLETKYQLEKLKMEGWEPGFSKLKRSLSNDDVEETSGKRVQH